MRIAHFLYFKQLGADCGRHSYAVATINTSRDTAADASTIAIKEVEVRRSPKGYNERRQEFPQQKTTRRRPCPAGTIRPM